MRATSILHAAVIILVILVSPASVLGASAKDVFAKVASSVVVVLALDKRGNVTGQGSGVVISDYEVVTNCHVLDKAADLMVRQAADWSGGKVYRMSAFLLVRNDERDLCLLFVDELPIPPVPQAARLGAAKQLSVGEEVYAVGAPAGLELSLSRGIVSQLRKAFGKLSAPLVQTDAALSPGSSGGGLFNRAGELVGITTFKWRGENLNFAMPSEWVGELQAQGRTELIRAKRRVTCMMNPKYVCVMDLALHATISTDHFLARADSFRDIASSQAEIGDTQGAQQTLVAAARDADLEPDSVKVFVVEKLAKVAVMQTKIGDKRAAKQTFSTLRKAVNAVHIRGERDQALSNFSSALAKAGHIAKALEIASSIQWVSYRNRALLDVARAQAGARDIANAMKTTMNVEGERQRTEALLMISERQAKTGDFKGAIKTVMNIKIPDARMRGVFLFPIVAWQLVGGDMKTAERTIALSPDYPMLRVLSGIIQARKDNFAAALAIADGFPRNQDGIAFRVHLLNEVAVMQAKAGKALDAKRTLADGLETARSSDAAGNRAILMSAVAAAQSKTGDPKAAEQTFAQVAEAFEIARKKDAPDWMPRIDPHSLSSYRRNASAISSGWLLRDVLKTIAQSQAKAGFFEDAVKTALSIDILKYRVEALVDIARYLAGKPPPPFWDPRRSEF